MNELAKKAFRPLVVAALIALEGLLLMPYQDDAGVWTNGVGNTKDVVPGTPITRERALLDLDRNIEEHCAFIPGTVATLNQEQYAAYCLFTFNVGRGGWLGSSTRAAHNEGRYMDACLYMLRWDMVTVHPKGQKPRKVVSKGLARRRYVEYNYCIAGAPSAQWSQVPRR